MKTAALLIMLSFGLSLHPLPIRAQSKSPIAPIDKVAMAERVRSEFLHAWNGFKTYAWGHEHLRPVSKTYYDWHKESLLTTAVDALDVLILMGLKDEADGTREYIAQNLSFDKDIEVKNFEITIRLLGGLLSSYQLSGDKRLLALADDLGRRLLPAFNSPTGMPYMFVNLKTGAVRGSVSNPAEIGTLLVEFGTLSKLTEKPIYYEKAKHALVELFKRRSPIGLVGERINVETGEWMDSTSHISGAIDSYYEYLLKSWRLFDDRDCEQMWRASIDALNKYVAQTVDGNLWYGHVNMYTGKLLATHFGALDAFLPAVLSLSGDIERAKRLEESCYKMWTHFGIEPDEFDYVTMKATNPKYHLNPEIIESAYYLYYFTNDPRYLEMGKTFLESLIQYCKVDNGYTSLLSVETKEKMDLMDSYFLAETMKYLYLLFAPRETLDLSEVVFNTEAHPIRKMWKEE